MVLVLKPPWFSGYDIVLEVFFAIIVLAVSYYAFRVSHLTQKRELRLFGYGFLGISLSYMALSAANFLSLFLYYTSRFMGEETLFRATLINSLGIYAYIVLFVLGVYTLAYTTLRLDNNKAYLLFLVILLFSMVLSSNVLFMFHALCTIMLAFISLHYLLYLRNHRQARHFRMLLCFGFLLLARIGFLFSGYLPELYVVAHGLELLAYVLMLFNLLKVVRT